MAYEDNDWSSLFDPQDTDISPQAIPTPDPWWVITPDETEAGWGQGTGWDSFEAIKPLTEGVKTVGKMLQTAYAAPAQVAADIGQRIADVPPVSEVEIDWDLVPEDKVKDIRRIQDLNELVNTIGAVSSPGQAILGLFKLAGALEPDRAYQLRKQNKALEVQVAEDFIGTAPQMIMNMFAGKVAGPVGVVVTSGTQMFGAAYERHSVKNDPVEAAALAFMDAIPQTAIESLSTLFMLGGIDKFKPLMKGKVMSKLAKSLDKKPLNWLKTKLDTVTGHIVGSMATEGAEEYAQSIIEMGSDLVQMKMDGKEITGPAISELFAQKHKEGKYAAIVGALWGGTAGGFVELVDSPLRDANPKETPEAVKTEKDAKTILEEAGRRMVEGEQEPDPVMEPIVVDTASNEIELEEGAPGAETDVDYGVVFDMEPGKETLRYRVDKAAGEEDYEDFGLEKDQKYITITDPDSPAFKGTIVTTAGREDIDIARSERQFLRGKKDAPGYIENWMQNEKSRPDWADKRAQTMGTEQMWDAGVRSEAVRAYRKDSGEDVVQEASAVKELRRFLDGDDATYSSVYGDDFITQVDEAEMDTVSRAGKAIVEKFFNVPVFPVVLNEKAKADTTSRIHMHKGGRTSETGAITLIVDKDNPMRMINTLFHEKTHDLKQTNLKQFNKEADWIYKNSDEPKIAEALISLQETYTKYTPEQIAEELVAKVKGELATMEEYQVKLLKKLRKEDPKLYEKILTSIQEMLRDIRDFIKTSFGAVEGFKEILNDIDAAIDFFTDMAVEEFKAGKAGRMMGTTGKMDMKGLGSLMQNIMKNEKKSKTFFSRMNQFLFEGKSPKLQGKKLPAQQVRKQLIAWAKAGEFKAAELNWSPVLEWLDGKKVVSASDVETYMKENQVIVTSAVLKERGMTEDDISENMDRLEFIRNDLSNRYDMAFTDEEEIGSGLQVPRTVGFVTSGKKFEAEDDGSFGKFIPEVHGPDVKFFDLNFDTLNDIEAWALHHKDQLPIENQGPPSWTEAGSLKERSVKDIMYHLNSAAAIISGLEDSVGVIAGKAQYSPDEFPNLTTAGPILDYGEVLMKLDLPQYREAEKDYKKISKRHTMLGVEINEMRDDQKKHQSEVLGKGPNVSPEDDAIFSQRANDIISKIHEKQSVGMEMQASGAKLDTFYFEGGHYKGPVIGHFRFTLRKAWQGKTVFFIEEIQSDWQQRGRKRGFKGEMLQYGTRKIYTPTGFSWKKTGNPDDAITERGRRIAVGNVVLHQLIRDKNGEVVGEASDKVRALANAGIVQDQMVPDTPFKPFSELALKKIARMATEAGADYVAWTPAAEHIRRYNLAKYVDQLEYYKGNPVPGDPNFEKPVLKGYKNEGQVGTWVIEKGHTLEDYVGETIANQLEGQLTGRRKTAMMTVNAGTQVGDFKWAENLYDKMVPRMANKLFGKKSWGNARVRELEIDQTDDDATGQIVIKDSDGNKIERSSPLHELLENYEGETFAMVLAESKANYDRMNKAGEFEQSVPNSRNIEYKLDQEIEALEYMVSIDATFSEYIDDQPMPALGFPVTEKMQAITKKGQVLFDLAMPRAVKTPEEEALNEVSVSNGYFETDLADGISGDDYNRHYRERRLGFGEPSADWMESGRIIRDIWGSFKETEGSNSVALKTLSAVALGSDVRVDENDYGVIPIIESMGFKKVDKTLYRFDERIPQDADIIAGMYQAAWHVDLRTKRSTKKLYSQIAKQFGVDKGFGKGEGKLAKHKEKLKGYLNESWGTYRSAADGTSKGDFLPTKNVLLRPDGVKSGKGRQLLVQISSDFKSEGASNIGDSYYEALYNKREGYLRPSRDFWELPEWMTRMAYFMPKADVYVIRNLNEAKQFLNQAGYDTVFFSVLDITKGPVKSIAESYSGDILAGGYLPDGSYYKGMKNVTWVEDMPAAAKELGVEYKNGVDYRHFKNTKTIPRLEMSKGCLHKCAFCSQDRFLTISSPEAIDQQIAEYGAFDYEIVYLNDKTFGQAENFPDLVGIKDKIQKVNKNFKGFVIQTTATQYMKMSDEFLQNSGIVYVELGVETFNDKQLESLSKPHREKHILEAADKIRRLNQVFVPNVMVGLAGKNKDGSTWVESVRTYSRTLKFLNDNSDIISHLNIGVLAAETGTKLHEQLDAVESDQSEHNSTRSWLKNQKIHDRFFEQLSAMGEKQLDSEEVKAYVTKSIAINTHINAEPLSQKDKARGLFRAAGIKYGDKLFEGNSHMQILIDNGRLDKLLFDKSFDTSKLKSGFVTHAGEFLSRDEATKLLKSDKPLDSESFLKQPVAKVSPGLMEDLVGYQEGSKQSESYHKAYFDIFNIAKKAKGLKNVRNWLKKQGTLYDIPVTDMLVENIGNHADKLAKDKKRMLNLKKMVTLREGIASGLFDPRDPKIVKRMEKFPNFMPYTIRHTGSSFFIGENMKYGKFTDKVSLFDEGTDVTRVTKKPYIDPVTGATEVMEKYYDKDGVRLIKAPIFSTNKKKRIQEIKAIVKKNSKYSDWYKRWKNFVFQFSEDGAKDIEVKRIAAISGLLGAGKSPQIQQKIWTDTVNKLAAGRTPRKAAKNELTKIMDIWAGKYDDILGKTDDEGIREIQRVFGRKIGPYLAAAVDPSSPNVLVLDRHMPKGWGYNVLHSVGKQQGAFNMHPSIEHEIASDIFQVAEETGEDVAGVQAALWFDFRTPASDVSDIVNIAQIEPGDYVPYVWHKKTFPEITTGIHYKKTDLKIGDYVLGATARGEVMHSSYSRTDIGERIGRATKKWPYQPAVYMYTPEATPEPQIKTGKRAYTFKYDESEIYDGVNDPYMYWDEAKKQLAKEPEASLTNIFLKLVNMREQYKGAIVRSPYNPQEQKWIMVFEKAAIQDHPELTQVGISDVMEKIEKTPQKVEDAVLYMKPRAKALAAFMAAENKYSELTIDRSFPTLARFEETTSGMLEPGLSVKIDGPLRAQRAFLSEVGIARGQREVYLMHEPRPDTSYPAYTEYSEGKLFSFKVKNEWNDNAAGLVKALNKSGLKEFNIVESTSTGNISIEQFVYDVEDIDKTADIIDKFAEKGYPRNKVSDVHSEILSEKDYEESITEYWGETKGREIYNNAVKKGKEFRKGIRSGTYQKTIDPKEKGKDKRIDRPDPGVREDIEPETSDLLDRIGRHKVSLADKIREKTDYKKGTFVTGAIDDLNPLKMYAGAESEAYMLHRGLPGIQSSIEALLEHGKLTLDESGVLTTDTKGKGFIPWVHSLGKNSDKFWYWLIARRDESRQGRDKKYTPMFTEDERAKLFKWTGDKNENGKAWQAFNKEFQEYNQSVLDIGVKSGLLDPAMVRQFKDQFYIPFFRIFEDAQSTAEFIKAPVNTKRIIAAQIKKLHGSKRQMGDPMENILANWSHLLKQSMTNASRKAAFNELNDANTLSETGEPVVEEVPWKDTVIFKSGNDKKTTFIYEKQGIEVLGFKDNGKTRFFKVNDPELFQSLSLLPRSSMPQWLSRILGAPKALLTFGATITPSFVIANTTRDTMHTFTISDNFIPFWDTMRGFVKSIMKDQDYVEYMASGNAFVGSYIKADNPEAFAKFAKKLVKREKQGAIGTILDTPRKLFSFWEMFTEASENAARLALYSNLRKVGKTKLEASFSARDIMDFQKKGASPVVHYLTATVPFLNARIQGLHKMGTAAAKNPGMFTLKGGMIAMASLALWAAFKDDDRYKELEDWERFAYYHFWIGEHHFRIPKPFETGVIWSSAWTVAADVMTGNDEVDHITSFIGASLLDTFAFNPIPQAARPIMEQYFNKTFFTGRPIVPEGFKYRDPGERYYPWDHESAIVLGKALGVSPRRIQAVVRGYLAGLGLGIMAGTDIMVRQFAEFPERPTADIGSYPMIGRFAKKGPAKYTKYQSKFYDTFNELNQLSRRIKIAQEAGEWKDAAAMTKLNRKKLDAYSRAKNVKRMLGQNRKLVTEVWMDPNMSGDMKKKRLDKLAIDRNKEVKKFWDWYLENV